MLPEDIVFNEKVEQLSLTFKIDFENNKIVVKIDELEAVKQAVFLILKTERNYSEIYKDYGIKIIDLIGQDINFIASMLKQRITETLKEDDRITEVENFIFNEIDEGLEVGFDVISIYGSFTSKGVYDV